MSQDEIFEIEPPVKNKSGGGNKLLMGLGIGCGVVLLICGGVLVTAYFSIQQWVEDIANEDPAIVVQTTGTITEIEIPAQLPPRGSMDFKIPFTGQRLMTMTIYGDEEVGQRFLVLAQFDKDFVDETNREEMASQVKESLEGQMDTEQNITLNEEAAEEVQRTIRDEPATFVITQGTNDDSGDELWHVTGVFEGKGGPVFMIFVAPTEQFTREEIDQLIESIQ